MRTVAKRSAPRRPAPRATREAQAEGRAVRYLETSAVMAALLESDAMALDAMRGEGRPMTSALTFAEGFRSIVRARASGRIDARQAREATSLLESLERRCASIPVTDAVLSRSGRPFPIEPVRTLDAIHLASLEVIGVRAAHVVVATCDERVRVNARALGYRVEPA